MVCWAHNLTNLFRMNFWLVPWSSPSSRCFSHDFYFIFFFMYTHLYLFLFSYALMLLFPLFFLFRSTSSHILVSLSLFPVPFFHSLLLLLNVVNSIMYIFVYGVIAACVVHMNLWFTIRHVFFLFSCLCVVSGFVFFFLMVLSGVI